MSFGEALVAEAGARTLYLLLGVLLAGIVLRLLAPEERTRVRGFTLLFGLSLLLLPAAAALRAGGDPVAYRETVAVVSLLQALAVIGLLASFLFAVVASRLGLRAPRILSDVLVATAGVAAFFVAASRSGFNVSGLIATSTVLTAVIGLSLQDTLDDPTDGVVRTRVYLALKRVGIPLSIPAQAVFVTEESKERKAVKSGEERERRLAALGHVEFFDHLPAPDQERLADGLRYSPFAAGEMMTRQGAEAHWLYLVLTGQAKVLLRGVGGLEREVARLGPGEFFGEMSLMTGAPRQGGVPGRAARPARAGRARGRGPGPALGRPGGGPARPGRGSAPPARGRGRARSAGTHAPLLRPRAGRNRAVAATSKTP